MNINPNDTFIKLLDESIYPNLNRGELLKQIDTDISVQDKYVSNIECFFCKQREAFIANNSTGIAIKCNHRNNCNRTISIYNYTKEKLGLSSKETLELLAKHSNVTLPPLSPEVIKEIEKTTRQQKIQELAMEFYKEQLLTPQGKEGLNYLLEIRKWPSIEIIKKAGWGYNPGHEKTREYLLGKNIILSTEDILHFMEKRDDYKIVFPYYDCRGNLISLWGRRIDKEEPKYLPFSKTNKSNPFNIHNCLGFDPEEYSNIDTDELLLVEGYADALLLTVLGIPAAALATSSISNDHHNIIVKNFSKVTLALDADSAGLKGIESALTKFANDGVCIRVIETPEQYKDPEKWITTEGVEPFKKAMEAAPTIGKWAANRILSKYDFANNKSDKNRINVLVDTKEALNLCDPLSQFDLKEIVSKTLPVSLETLQAEIDESQRIRQAQQDEQKYKQACEAYGENYLKLVAEGNLEEAANSPKPSPLTSGLSRDFLLENNSREKIIESLANSPDDVKTGYAIAGKELIIPGGAISLVVARTGHGKTTMLTNILLNFIEQDRQKSSYFFTNEESIPALVSLVMNGWIGRKLNKEEKTNHISANGRRSITSFYRTGSTEYFDTAMREKFIELEDQFYKEVINTGRLRIVDISNRSAEMFIDDLYFISQRENQLGLACVDYMQLLKSESNKGSRQEELKDICADLNACVKKTGLPLLFAAQFNRTVANESLMSLEAIREAGDIEQVALLVLGIWNRNMTQNNIDKNGNKVNPEPTIYCDILKRRGDSTRDSEVFDFDGNLAKITNKPKTPLDEFPHTKDQSPHNKNKESYSAAQKTTDEDEIIMTEEQVMASLKQRKLQNEDK